MMNSMQTILLSQGKVTLVDNEDFFELNKFKWYARRNRKTFYATRNTNPRKLKLPQVQMHRIILGQIPLGKEVDHIDGDGLNNQRKNLRLVTKRENGINKSQYINNKSGFKGVSWNKREKKWSATGKLNGKQKNLGDFKNIEDAIRMRQKFVLKNYGEFTRKN